MNKFNEILIRQGTKISIKTNGTDGPYKIRTAKQDFLLVYPANTQTDTIIALSKTIKAHHLYSNTHIVLETDAEMLLSIKPYGHNQENTLYRWHAKTVSEGFSWVTGIDFNNIRWTVSPLNNKSDTFKYYVNYNYINPNKSTYTYISLSTI